MRAETCRANRLEVERSSATGRSLGHYRSVWQGWPRAHSSSAELGQGHCGGVAGRWRYRRRFHLSLRDPCWYRLGSGISEKVVWWVVRQYAKIAAIEKLSPHDLRRTCARLCHSTGGELEQIQFLLGHRSVETTERYLGSRQRLVHAVNDKLGIEPDISLG